MTTHVRGELLGFLVQEMPDDISSTDILHQERLLYATWDSAIIAASLLTNTLSDKYNARATCVLRSTSRAACLDNGYVTSHRLHDWRCDVLIFPVFAATQRRT